jgi:phage shock protein A
VVLVGALALVLAAGCGGGGDDGGGGGSEAGDLAAQAVAVGAHLDQIEALPTSATTVDEFSAQLAPLREQVDALTEQVAQTDAPDELSSQRDQLSNRLRGLRTQLGRVNGLLIADNLEGAKVATEQLLSIAQLRQTISAIESAAGGG